MEPDGRLFSAENITTPTQGNRLTQQRNWDTTDTLIASLVFICTLLLYARTLAPDLLYGDSSEFQMLAYSPGIAHTTGYPIYVSITWLLNFVPLGILAWRVNALSALAAAGTVAGIYALCRMLTARRAAAILSCFALAISYTFWSQAVITEVYTVGTLWWVLMIICLWHWSQAPNARSRWLFASAFLSGLGLGVHLYTTLFAPAALLLFVLTVRGQPAWRRLFTIAAAGVMAGVTLYLLAFYVIDSQQTLADFNRAMFVPSRSAWGLELSDVDSFWERFYHTVTATQWQSAMFPEGFSVRFMLERAALYFGRILVYEFSLLIFISAIAGWRSIRKHNKPFASFLLVAYATIVFVIMNYEPGDKHIFYLPSYLLLTVAASAGIANLLTWLEARTSNQMIRSVGLLLVILLVGQHFWPARLQAVADGRASFVSDTYPYPVDDLNEPRVYATQVANSLPDGALLLMNWRPIFTVIYVAHVEQGKTNLAVIEPTPYGSNGKVPQSLVEHITDALNAGQPVFADATYDLSNYFRMQRQGSGLYKIMLRN